MQTFRIPYGCGFCTFDVEDARVQGILTPRKQLEHSFDSISQDEIVRQALSHPVGSQRLCEIARGKKNILVITSDHTRPMPSRITLPLLLEELRRKNPTCDVRILVATGMHRAMTLEEQSRRFGEDIVRNENIIVHNAFDDAEMVDLGVLPSGGRLRVNRLVKWAELVVAEGFIEPHFFAGFSGGRKSILPGIAARETIVHNHNAQFIASAHARQGILAENPIHRDMIFAAEQAKLAFILNVLLDENKQIAAAFAGNLNDAHEAGCRACLAHARVPLVSADIVVTSNGGYPLDQNFYQCVKSLTAAERCVRQGGCIILCAAMEDGHGGAGFFHWFADRPGPESVLSDIETIPPEETLPDQWQAQILARVMLRAHCIIVTGEENRAFIEAMHLEWAATARQALESAARRMGADSTVTVIPNGVEVIVGEEV